MSSVFRGSRGDTETGFPGFVPERRPLRMHGRGRTPANAISMVFLVAILLFIILNSEQTSPNFLVWLVLCVYLMVTTLRMYATCQQLQAQAQGHAAASSGWLGHTELRVHMPPSIGFATRGRPQGLRLHLSLLDREFDDLDYDTLRALDDDSSPDVPSMTEEEINSLPVHKYKGQSCNGSLNTQSDVSALQQGSLSSTASEEKSHTDRSTLADNELTCSVCLEQINIGELVRTLPCLHQFHSNCIDPWLRQKGTCPVCKYRAGSGWDRSSGSETDALSMV